MSETAAAQPISKPALPPILIALAAWLVPGLGHLLLRRFGRAITFFIAVGSLALVGYHLRGLVFPIHLGDFRADTLTFLGGLGDAGSGIFYFLSRVLESAGADISRAAGDYGTRFIAAAGVANYLCVVDAWEIAIGRKE